MSKSAIKVVTTKRGKQLSGYLFLRYDMKFAARAFGLAATRGVRSVQERWANQPSAEDLALVLQAVDPILRKGVAMMQSYEDYGDESEAEKRALFEAGIVTYGRCFNSGLRTKLDKKIFTGDFSTNRTLHDAIIEARNRHVAHSELAMERSIIGFQLIDDQNYGKRQSMVLTTLTMRRHFPTNERLTELASHCRAIIERVIEPIILEKSRALREDLLQMPAEQIERFPEFGATMPKFENIL